ncbi:hypothetical protein DICSQDRAFT_123871 [Dichomitus squalens LYAD-421 SS1]|uniref:uncharacterized protein n=1 Tax=Dichomitus squalens (strain LYAD-421) TaxID=732165 RepID=UPI000441492B|nr:uncharacterized protein DICSQDRAFT_123871 [Dichomitus squalens LYAD-421 SS1]EJF65685.1 hypothetical protein DICSQDRAFT_123871 [Dichomitus squalens LYAD-421 SS1]
MSSPLRALSPGSSLASYDYFSAHSRSHSDPRDSSSGDSDSYGTLSDDGSSDDEILLSFSELSSADLRSQRGALTPALFSDDEFVLMSRPRSPASGDDLTASFSELSLSSRSRGYGHRRVASGSSTGSAKSQASYPNSSPKRRNRKRRAAQTPGNGRAEDGQHHGQQPQGNGESYDAKLKHHSPSKARRKARRAASQAVAAGQTQDLALVPAYPAAGLGDRGIVDDVSEAGSEYSYIPPELYRSAQRYVSSYVHLISTFLCVPR